MRKPSYLFRAAEAEDIFSVYQEGLNDVKHALAETLGQYHKADMPLVIAAMEFVTSALLQHPRMETPGAKALLQHIEDSFSVVNTYHLQKAAEAILRGEDEEPAEDQERSS